MVTRFPDDELFDFIPFPGFEALDAGAELSLFSRVGGMLGLSAGKRCCGRGGLCGT